MTNPYNPWFHKYPGTNFHEQNIDWITEKVGQLSEELKGFIDVNSIKYGGAWDITKQYGPNTVVVDSDKGYISIKPVPAGITLDNNDYWVEIADFTAEMAQMDARMDDLEDAQAALESEMAAVVSATSKGTFKDRTILFIGDSWGAGWNNDEGTVTSPETVCANLLQPKAYYRKDEGGAGFAYANGHWYGKLLEDFVSEQSAEVVASITDIVITGGQNDLGDSADYVDTNTLYEAKWCANYISTNFPNARIFLGMVARTSGCNSDATYGNLQRTINRYEEICRKYNWHYINRSHLMIHNYAYLSTDGKHLLETGYIFLGNALAQAILSGSYRIPTAGVTNLAIEDAADTTGTLINSQVTDAGIKQFLTPDGVLLYNDSCKIWEITTDTNLSANTVYTLCQLSKDNFFHPLYRSSIAVNVVLVVDGTAEIVPAEINISEGQKFGLRLMKTSSNGANWATFSNVSRIIFQPFSTFIPADYC